MQSAKIITSHVTYGLKLAKEVGLPTRVADFIPQHHGTRTLHFFLRKAEKQAENGAPFDVLAAADESYIADLERKGLTVPDTRALYAFLPASACAAVFVEK